MKYHPNLHDVTKNKYAVYEDGIKTLETLDGYLALSIKSMSFAAKVEIKVTRTSK